MTYRIIATVGILLIFGGCNSEAQNRTPGALNSVEEPAGYTLPNTEVRRIQSLENGINYGLYISVPAEYERTSKKYPVLFHLDADYSFAIAHNVVEHFTQRNNIDGLILVGIAYEGKSQDRFTYRKNRVRDYTPTHVETGFYTDEVVSFSGGGMSFIKFLRNELVPFMENNYRVSDDRGITGHSLGGYFATYMLVNHPELFNKYILVSPSLWYDDGMIFDTDFSTLTGYQDKTLRVFFAVGEHENQPWQGWPMVDDMQRMVGRLDSLGLRNLEVDSQVFENEIHNSIFPVAFSRGVRILYD